MAIEITVPRLGWSMEEGVFAGWLKRDGDPVRAGDALFSLEGEKATQDVEAIDDGTLNIPPTAPEVGATIAVGAVIGYLLGAGEAPPTAATPDREPAAVTAPPIRVEHQPQSRPARDRPRSSPLARRIAKEQGIDWSKLVGSGRTGRVRRADVLEAVEARNGASRSRVSEPVDPVRSTPVSPARRLIAARMIESRRTTAPVTLTTTVDATNLVGLRQQFKAADPSGGDVPSFTDFVVKLTALALRDHPFLNARWDDGADRITLNDEAHVGIAVDTEAGLTVPVIRGAAGLGLRQIATRSLDLIRRARAQQLRPDDVQGGTFTVTNLGSFGVETFTPIIRPPECAILGIGRIERRPVMVGADVSGRDRMSLSLTFDHRIVDGAPAARFLQQLARQIENPGPWLMA